MARSLALSLIALFAGCSCDDPSVTGQGGAGTLSGPGVGGSGAGNVGGGGGSGPCVGLECQQVTCEGGGTTRLSGRVYIPAGTLPLPNVRVFVPNAELEPIVDELGCDRCEDFLSGNPLVYTETDETGSFVLENMPVGSNIPVVMQVGKWRRQVQLPSIEPCTNNTLSANAEAELLRLPRNRGEGDIPRIALTTGGADALECLLRKMGIDDEEITNGEGSGRVHLYAGGGGTRRFAEELHDGADISMAVPFWNELENLTNYDVIIFSCEGGAGNNNSGDAFKSEQAVENVRDYVNLGGRIFASHWHNRWIDDRSGHADFQPIATWNRTSNPPNNEMIGFVDTMFDKGLMLAEWLDHLGDSEVFGQIPIEGARRTLEEVHPPAQRWLYNEELDSVQNFSVNTPIGAPDDEQCGRVVFSDMHVSAGDNSSTTTRFPDGCETEDLTPQEKALVFMMFDLAACIEPDVPGPN